MCPEANPASYPMGGEACSGRDADHTPRSSAEVKNEQELYSSPPWRLHGGSWTVLLCYFLKILDAVGGGGSDNERVIW
jgi:hypothetical protein